ncbi:MAG: DUF3800 domain-containing protein [Candidatus Glassbacteria bacterium]
MKYRIYIDEVGNPDLESSDNPNHRFLSLTGVILELRYVESIVQPQLEALKKKYFKSHPDEPVIFHRKEIMNAKNAFAILRNPDIRRRFDDELIHALSTWQYTVITVCIDKKRHKETYQTWRYDPYHYCLAVILERYVFFLNQCAEQGDVIAESRGGREDIWLKVSFERLWNQGTEFVEPSQFQKALTSQQLKVKPKLNNIAGLQLADLLAHPSRNEILLEQGFIAESQASFAKRIVEILQYKYYQREGRIFGFGKKFL